MRTPQSPSSTRPLHPLQINSGERAAPARLFTDSEISRAVDADLDNMLGDKAKAARSRNVVYDLNEDETFPYEANLSSISMKTLDDRSEFHTSRNKGYFERKKGDSWHTSLVNDQCRGCLLL
jgi:hypothetical protein